MNKKLINWKEYNKELKNRGSVTLWFDPENTGKWYAVHDPKKSSKPFIYSPIAIEILCLLKTRFGLTLRAVQGFAESLFNLVGSNIAIPNYSTLSRRMGKLEIELEGIAAKEGPIDVVVDSSGLKVYGEGEWKVKIHGRQKHRTWRKIHLAVNPQNGKILSAALSINDFKDSEMFQDFLENIKDIKRVAADGAYEFKNCYNYLDKRNAKALIPPRKNAKISRRGSMDLRDQTIRAVRKNGRNRWKKESN